MDVANLGHEDGIPESLPQCGVWLFFSFLSKNAQNMSKTHTRRDFSRLFGVDVLWRHRWITSGMGLSHPPGWDNISPDSKLADIPVSREYLFSHRRLHKPTGSLVLDRSIRDGDLARGIHALPVKVNRAMQLSLLALSYYVADHDVTTRTLSFPRRQSYVLPS